MGSFDRRVEAQNEAVAALVSGMSSDVYGAVSSSVYETARLVTLAPWLAGHLQRILFLLQNQHPDGTWGAPDGYGLVPTLSATEALLTCLRRWPDGYGRDLNYEKITGAVDRGLHALFRWLRSGVRVLIPDTVAVEIVVPALVAQINEQLDMLAVNPVTGLDIWGGSGRLLLPPGVDDTLLARLRHSAARGVALPAKLLHSLEVLGPAARGAPFVRPTRGAVGCSPAATAAWVSDRTDDISITYLETVQNRAKGPVPGVTPIPTFERAWVLAALTTAGIGVTLPPGLVDSLHAAFGEFGVAAGPGLPPDSDDTAGTLYALAQLGSPRTTDCLWAYQMDTHFSCFPAERTLSTSTNAHILQAFGKYLEHGISERSRAAVGKLSGWLGDCQETDGSWWDKWHASPYYATACCVTALHHYSRGASATVISRAAEWLLGSQRNDGSWGRWNGTCEETAYAVQTLVQASVAGSNRAVEQAAARGCVFLQGLANNHQPAPLWHDKDLYTPLRVVHAERLAALQLAYANPHIAALLVTRAPRTPNERRQGEAR